MGKDRDEITNVLTPFEKARLEKIEANKNKLRSLMITTEEQTKMASHKVVHASSRGGVGRRRMWDIAKRKQKTKMSNAERRRRKVDALKSQLEKAEKRLTDIVTEVREANQSVDTAVKVLEAIRARAQTRRTRPRRQERAAQTRQGKVHAKHERRKTSFG